MSDFYDVGVRVTAARERRRIRRLIAKHLKTLLYPWGVPRTDFLDAISAIDAATRAPKKERAK